MKTLKENSVVGKRVLVRCDFNVPIDKKGKILNDFRIKKMLPTIKYLIEGGAKIILMSHLGNPNGEIVKELKLDEVAKRLSELLDMPINKLDNCVGPEAEAKSNELELGEILLLENLRFHKGEKENDKEFAKQLSYLGDLYVNDAFGVCHRNHASIVGIVENLSFCAGLLLEKEIEVLDKVLQNPEKPMIVIVGGTKVATKSNFINKISRVADLVIISGLIAKEISEKNIVFEMPEKIIIPIGDLGALDINEESIKIFQEKILESKTILWNGPFGKFEKEKYAKGTLALAEAIIESGAYSVVGGGETVEFITNKGIIDKFSHVSTGGGAMLDYLSGDKLPGIEALSL